MYDSQQPSLRLAMLWRLECPICFELMKDAVVTSCGHSFCSACAEANCCPGKSCPSCRRAVSLLIPNYFVRELVADVADTVDDASPVQVAIPAIPDFGQSGAGLQWLDSLGFSADVAALALRQAGYDAEEAVELALQLQAGRPPQRRLSAGTAASDMSQGSDLPGLGMRRRQSRPVLYRLSPRGLRLRGSRHTSPSTEARVPNPEAEHAPSASILPAIDGSLRGRRNSTCIVEVEDPIRPPSCGSLSPPPSSLATQPKSSHPGGRPASRRAPRVPRPPATQQSSTSSGRTAFNGRRSMTSSGKCSPC
eukprot:EG_transcript_15617